MSNKLLFFTAGCASVNALNHSTVGTCRTSWFVGSAVLHKA